MKIYLDNSVLNRPFDNQSIPKIRLETIALFYILELIEKKKVKLVNSSIIEYENSKNPFIERKLWIEKIFSKATIYQKITPEIKKLAKEIEKQRISPLDSLHLSSAIASKVDYFITCDYTLVKRYKNKLQVINPIDFIQIFNKPI